MQFEYLDTTALKSRRPQSRSTSVFRSLRNVAACALGFAVITGILFGRDAHGVDVQFLGAGLGVFIGIVLWAKRGL